MGSMPNLIAVCHVVRAYYGDPPENWVPRVPPVKVTQRHRTWHGSIGTFHSNLGPVLYRFQDKARRPKIDSFFYPRVFSTLKFCNSRCTPKKLEWWVSRTRNKFYDVLSRCDIIHECHRRTKICRRHVPRLRDMAFLRGCICQISTGGGQHFVKWSHVELIVHFLHYDLEACPLRNSIQFLKFRNKWKVFDRS